MWSWDGANPDHWVLLSSNDQFDSYEIYASAAGNQREYDSPTSGWWKVRGLDAESDPVTDDSNPVAVEDG